MPDIVESNGAVAARATAYIAALNADSILELFLAPTVLDPSLTYGSFTLAGYPGYAAITITGQWAAPVQLVAGQWSSLLNVQSFPAPTSGAGTTIYGALVRDSFTNVLMSYLFATPINFNPGDPPILAQINYNFWARILLP